MTQQDNSAQVAYWNADAAQNWVRYQVQLDRAMTAIMRRLLKAIDVKPGNQVLDVGCGSGALSLALAPRVRPDGHVTGVDISRLLLALARDRAQMAAVDATFLEADASAHAFEPARFDWLVSRFGVMFFADPAAAFSNLRKALKPGGRVAFVCWRPLPENDWVSIPSATLAPLLPPADARPDPDAPGPFALAREDRLRSVLTDAGFQDINLQAVRTHMTLGEGDDALEQAVEFCVRIGPAAAALREAGDDSLFDKARSALRETLAPHAQPTQLVLGASIWLATARA